MTAFNAIPLNQRDPVSIIQNSGFTSVYDNGMAVSKTSASVEKQNNKTTYRVQPYPAVSIAPNSAELHGTLHAKSSAYD